MESSERTLGAIRRRATSTPLFILPAAILYSVFVLWPMVRVGWLSLFRWTGFGPQTFIGLANFSTLWNDGGFRASVAHMLLWDGASLLLPTALSLGVALLTVRSYGQPVLLATLFFPPLLPPTAVAAIWTLVYSPFSGPIATLLNGLGRGPGPGWLGDPHLALPALFVAWLWSATGIGVVVLWSGLRGIAPEWREIALLEGAGPIWRFRHVILPGLRRALPTIAIVNVALGSAVFDLIFVTTGGGPGNATMIVPLEVYARVFGGRVGEGSAAACVGVALGLLLAAAAALLLRPDRQSLETGSGGEPERATLPTSLAVVAAVLTLLPILWLIPIALTTSLAATITGPSLDPRDWSWANVSSAWSAGMGGAMGTSILLAAIVVLGVMLLAAPAAFSLAHRTGRRGQAVAAVLLLAGLFQATPALLAPLFALLNDLDLLDTLPGIVLPEIARALPFAVLALWAFLAATPRDAIEAAEVDGASPMRQMISIALPIAWPAILAVAIWTFATSWNEYLLPTLVSQDGSIVTVPMLLGTFIGRYNTQLGPLAAGCLLAILPSLAVYLLLRRGAATGLAGMKGPIR